MGLFDALADRDAALTQVGDNAESANSFMSRGLREIDRLPAGEWTGEEVREYLTRLYVAPHHPNAWGALIAKAVRDGLLVTTGERRAMRGPRSHGRRTDVYRVGNGVILSLSGVTPNVQVSSSTPTDGRRA